jgi:hypothetical protein
MSQVEVQYEPFFIDKEAVISINKVKEDTQISKLFISVKSLAPHSLQKKSIGANFELFSVILLFTKNHKISFFLLLKFNLIGGMHLSL